MSERRGSTRKARGGYRQALGSEGRGVGDWEFWTLCGLATGAIVVLASRAFHTASSPVDARDENANCVFWAAQGECARNRAYMLAHCRRSCRAGDGVSAADAPKGRSAMDPATEPFGHGPAAAIGGGFALSNATTSITPAQCEAWRANGDCETSALFMQLHCARTCGYGPPDRQRHCRFWSHNGECTRSTAFMRIQCAASCEPFFEGLRYVNASSSADDLLDASARKPPGATDVAGAASAARAADGATRDALLDAAATALAEGGGASTGGEGAAPASAGGAPAVAAALPTGSRARHPSAAVPFRIGIDLLHTPICIPVADHRPDCAAIVEMGHCHDESAVETLQRCFLSCSAKEPEHVLRQLRAYPDPPPPRIIAPIEALGALTTLQSACMGGQNRPMHEPPAVWRRRLLFAFGPRALTHCTARHERMTARVNSWIGEASQRVVVTVHGGGDAAAVLERVVTAVHLRDAPRVRMLVDFLTDDENAELLVAARPLFKQMPPLGGYRPAVRNASVAVLPRDSPISRHVAVLASHFAHVPTSHVESLHVLHYAPYQLYEQHVDYLDSCDLSNRFYGGRRMLTFHIHLNDLEPSEAGGRTRFPELGLDVAPRKNSALVFENCDGHGNDDPRSAHVGDAPLESDKYVLNVWIRSAPFAAFAGAADSQVLR